MTEPDGSLGDNAQPLSANARAIQELKEGCEKLYDDLSKTQEEFSKTGHVQSLPDSSVQLQIHQATIRQLKAEIEAEKNKNIEPLPQDSTILYELLKDDLSQSIRQLQFTLAAVRSQKRELKERIDREKEFLSEHQQIKAALEQKISESVNHQFRVNESGFKKELNEKTSKAKAYLRQVAKWLLQFVTQHYPPPTAEQTAKWRRRNPQEAGDEISPMEYVPLENILEELMNKVIESPHDPYIEVERGHWPPYIELLLRVGIALKHPETDNKIKMTPYHY